MELKLVLGYTTATAWQHEPTRLICDVLADRQLGENLNEIIDARILVPKPEPEEIYRDQSREYKILNCKERNCAIPPNSILAKRTEKRRKLF